MIGSDIVSPEPVPTRTHSLDPDRMPVSAGGRDAGAVSLMVHGPYGDRDTSAIQGCDGASAGHCMATVQPSCAAGHDHDSRSDAGAAVDGAQADGVPESPVVTLGRARLHMAKK